MNQFVDNDQSLITTIPFSVNSSISDMNCRLRLGAFVDLLIQSAIKSADSLNAGLAELKNQNLFWVLSRLTLEIKQPIRWYQSGTIDTWPKNVEKIIFLRDFLVNDEHNEVIAKATSGWLAVDILTKRPKTLNRDLIESFTRLKNHHAIDCMPEKLFSIKEGNSHLVSATYFDIDVNKHVTASRYIDWMMDSIDVEFLMNNYPKLLTINYINETLINESIRVTSQLIEDKAYIFEGFNLKRNLTAFLGKIVF